MCYGNVDPRNLTRDIEARLAHMPVPADRKSPGFLPAAAGLAARIAAWFQALAVKKATHG